MVAEVRAPNPRASRVVAKLIAERALDHEDFLATPVGVRLKAGPRCPANQRDMLSTKFVEGKHRQPGHKPGAPIGKPGVDHDTRTVFRSELTELDE